MNAFRKMSALVVLSAALAAGPAVAAVTVSPSAPESEQDASTVQVQDMIQTTGQNAPRSGINPIAPRSEQNASTVQPADGARAAAGDPAPRIGLSPSSTEAEFDATTVRTSDFN